MIGGVAPLWVVTELRVFLDICTRIQTHTGDNGIQSDIGDMGAVRAFSVITFARCSFDDLRRLSIFLKSQKRSDLKAATDQLDEEAAPESRTQTAECPWSVSFSRFDVLFRLP
jgi:hypothetical protein